MGDPERPEVAGPELEEVNAAAAAAFPQVPGPRGRREAGGGGDGQGAGPLQDTAPAAGGNAG